MVFDEAVQLIAEHKAAGRDVIIISSSGTEIVEPIGERLGVDLANGTQVAIQDGEYTGEILFYAYGEGKADAMRELAVERGYELAESFAYCDSFTDLPMLDLVGHPFAVNPDSELRKLATERGWPILDFAKPVAMRNRSTAAGGRGRQCGGATLRLADLVRPPPRKAPDGESRRLHRVRGNAGDPRCRGARRYSARCRHPGRGNGRVPQRLARLARPRSRRPAAACSGPRVRRSRRGRRYWGREVASRRPRHRAVRMCLRRV
jgi:hypothetical protein